MERGSGDGARRLARWMLAYSEVMAIAALLAGPPLLGLVLDSQFGLSPGGVVAGAVLGVALGIIKLMSWNESLSRRGPEDRSARSNPAPRDLDEGGQPEPVSRR